MSKNLVGEFVKFESWRHGFEGDLVGQIIEMLGNNVFIRSLNPKDPEVYMRDIKEDKFKLLTKEQFVIYKLEF